MYSNALYTIVCLLFLSFTSEAQDCTLDIGGNNSEVVIGIFQLNEAQIATMERLAAELEIENKTVEDDIKKLLNEHPQSTTEDLMTLAGKYKKLQQKIIDASLAKEKELLSQFNEKQYERYLILCNEAFREPIRVVPLQINDTIDPE